MFQNLKKNMVKLKKNIYIYISCNGLKLKEIIRIQMLFFFYFFFEE